MRNLVGVVLGLVPAVCLVLVGIGNRHRVDLNLVVTTLRDQELGVIVLGAFLLGAALAALGFAWPIVRVRWRLRRETRRVAQLEREVHGLRTLPLSDDDDSKATEAREA